MKISLYSTSSWKRQGVAMLWIAALLTPCGQSLVYAQLSASDIAAMKQEITKQKYTFTVDENPATKIPLSQLCGTIPSLAPKSANSLSSKPMVAGPALPSYWDWRQHNGVTPVKDQGNCGSCWAFSTVGTMEAMILIGSGTTNDLSEQQLVSCNPYGWGCGGGNFVFDMEISSGAMLESCFPYQAADVACQSGCPYVYQLSSWGYVDNSYSVPSTAAIKNAIYTCGPISVCVAVDGYFQAYSGGVFNHNSASFIDHAVVLVGWDDTNSCWIMKNSWGTGWGESGYMRIAYGCDQIGYAAAYAVWEMPEPLRITPGTGFTSSGGVGGPFTVTSESLSLTNAGTNSLTWTLANTSVWLNASPSGGTLTHGGPAATVTVSLNTAASNLVVGTYSATVWFTNLNTSVGQGRQFTLAVISPPTITNQPADQAVLEGATATFTVGATGGLPLSYQWQDNGTNLADCGNISGSTTTNLTLSNVSAANVGTYTVVVTNLAGVVTSSNALLAIIPSLPVIITQPANQTAIVGGTAAFTVAAIGTTPFSYQWSFVGTNIVGATNATLALANVQLSQAGSYAVVVSNVLGSATSSNAMLTVYTVPVINSFSPPSGTAGMVVNISGYNFDPTPGNNIVYFGAVQAVVTAASATNLVVTVPVGATYAPITETVNGLTAYANAPFLPTFPSAGVFTNSSLGPQVTLAAGNSPSTVVIADFDGDGKPDLAVNNSGDHTIYIYRNISTNGTLTAGSFAPPVVLPLGTGGENIMVAADVDGDGKPDLVLLDYNANQVMVLKNLCTPGNITTNSFGPRVNFEVGSGPRGVAVRDLDGDGKPEIVVANWNDNTISVLRNIGTTGSITTNSFAPAISFATGLNPQNVMLADMDGDGKPDVVTVDDGSSGNPAMSVLRNISTLGNIAFATHVDFSGLPYSYSLAVGDLDGDGKPDVVIGSLPGGQAISVYRNTSTPGSITTNSFARRVDFATSGWANGVAIGDLDGDGKPDVAVATQLPSQLSVFRNTSTPGSFTTSSFAPRLDFSAGYNANGVAIGDLDGDDRPDILFCNSYDNTVSVYQNEVPFGGAPVITTQPTNQTVTVGGTATFSMMANGTPPLSYQWSFNGTNIAGATNTSLILTNVQASQAGNYTVLVTNVYGSILSSNAVLTVNSTPPVPVIFGFSPISGIAGTSVTISGTNFSPVATSNIVYFGAVRATVSAASATNLMVSVPVGAIYAPITETVNGLTAYANGPFLPTFPSVGVFTNSSLGPQVTLAAGNGPFTMVIADLDGDGKPDLAVNNYSSHTISIYRNISTNGSLTASSFAQRVDLPISSGGEDTMVAADVTGDGKLDLVLLDYNANQVMVLKNLCTPGNITTNSFGPRVNFTVGAGPRGVAVQDLDGDGKPEIVTANGSDNTVSVLRNIGTMGSLTSNSFASAISFPAGIVPQSVVIADVDGDGKPDVVTVNNNSVGSSTVSVLRNVSTMGNIVLVSNVDLAGPNGGYSLAIGDLDGDGKLDLAVSSQGGGQLSVYRNVSTPGSITTNSFAARVDFAVGGWGNSVAIGDLDGDGKPDVAVVTQLPNHLSLFKNTSTPGSFTTNSFAARVDFSTGSNPNGVVIGDLDGDGRPDIAFANSYNATVSVYQNEVPYGVPPSITSQPMNQTVCRSSNATFSVTASGSAPLIYQWNFDGTNIAAATNTSLTLTNVQLNQAGNYAVLVTNTCGSIMSSNAVLTVNPLFHFAWNQIPSPRFVNAPFAVVVQALDVTNDVATNFTNTVILLSTNGVPVNPTVSGDFVQGVWTGVVAVAQTATNLVLQASDSFGESGLANPINVISLPNLGMTCSGNIALFMWPVGYSGFVLETSVSLSPATWGVVPYSPIQIGDQYLLPLDMSGTNGFYRLWFPGP